MKNKKLFIFVCLIFSMHSCVGEGALSKLKRRLSGLLKAKGFDVAKNIEVIPTEGELKILASERLFHDELARYAISGSGLHVRKGVIKDYVIKYLRRNQCSHLNFPDLRTMYQDSSLDQRELVATIKRLYEGYEERWAKVLKKMGVNPKAVITEGCVAAMVYYDPDLFSWLMELIYLKVVCLECEIFYGDVMLTCGDGIGSPDYGDGMDPPELL